MNEPTPIRVLLIDASAAVRERLRTLIEEGGMARALGEAHEVAEAVAQFESLKPDAVVMDFNLGGGGSTLLVTFKRRRPACFVIVLSSLATPDFRDTCLALGADYFFNKSMEFERVPEVLESLRQGLCQRDPMLQSTPALQQKGTCP